MAINRPLKGVKLNETYVFAAEIWEVIFFSDLRYEEIKDYNFDKPGFAFNTGHFTQVSVLTHGGGVDFFRRSLILVLKVSFNPSNFAIYFSQNVEGRLNRF